jgi:phosphoribosylformylglycinamidine synthase subunit PurQ / glutaminase
MKSIESLIITGYGINCEKEMAHACKKAGANSTIEHANDLLNGNVDITKYHLIAFPGGFSFADELGAGKAFANRLSFSHQKGSSLKERLHQFIADGKCIIGICNGFQLLVKLGLLPNFKEADSKQELSLTHNDSQKFESRWVNHRVLQTPCVFTQGLEKLYLPVRHAEGKLVARHTEVIDNLFHNNQVVLQYADPHGNAAYSYPDNPNGSIQSIAGLCDETGRVFGMMAHPEAALYFTNHPHWHRLREVAKRKGEKIPEEGDGNKIFINGIQYLRDNL